MLPSAACMPLQADPSIVCEHEKLGLLASDLTMLQPASPEEAGISLWTPANGVELKRQRQPKQKPLGSGRSTTGEAAARSEQYSASISG